MRGQHEICERDSLLAAVSKKIEYYDDEETGQVHRHCPPKITLLNRKMNSGMYSIRCRTSTLPDGVRSLQLRGIALPNNIKDEIFLIIGERRF